VPCIMLLGRIILMGSAWKRSFVRFIFAARFIAFDIAGIFATGTAVRHLGQRAYSTIVRNG
jgi:hypothetical protein